MTYPEQPLAPELNLPIYSLGVGVGDIYYTSFTSMLNMVNEHIEYGEHDEGTYRIEEKLASRIAYKHNPEVTIWKPEVTI
jgi:hypothetical protein